MCSKEEDSKTENVVTAGFSSQRIAAMEDCLKACMSSVADFSSHLAKMSALLEEEKKKNADNTDRFQLEERLFLAELEISESKDSGILTGHKDASHGGAIYDEKRRIIVSVSADQNRCRDVFITHLADASHGSPERKPNLLPFACNYRRPVYDGDRYIYFTESTVGGGNGKLFGRLDLDSFKFDELPSLPSDPFKMFGGSYGGCFHQGIVFMVDIDAKLCGFDVKKGVWSRYNVTLPTTASAVPKPGTDLWGQYGTLLSDPKDEKYLYCLGINEKCGLYRIDLDSLAVIMLNPNPYNCGVYCSVLVRPFPESDNFVIVAQAQGGSWYMYSSKKNTWRELSKWNKEFVDLVKYYIVFANSTKTFYFHINGHLTWESVQL